MAAQAQKPSQEKEEKRERNKLMFKFSEIDTNKSCFSNEIQ